MNPVFINGIGIISTAAKNSAELLKLAKGDNFSENNFGYAISNSFANSAALVVKNFKGGEVN